MSKNPGQEKTWPEAQPEAPANSFKKPIQNKKQDPRRWSGVRSAPPHFWGERRLRRERCCFEFCICFFIGICWSFWLSFWPSFFLAWIFGHFPSTFFRHFLLSKNLSKLTERFLANRFLDKNTWIKLCLKILVRKNRGP